MLARYPIDAIHKFFVLSVKIIRNLMLSNHVRRELVVFTRAANFPFL